jgi:crotonobetainyl-CoA:carnitine CoA-transferase CaiB-like acyl-CoA transferase
MTPAEETEEPEETERTGLAALTGLRVVEMGVWVAAPSAGALLADWGADVIKVEPPHGDPMRSAFGSLGIGQDFPNPAFAQDNRGKRSVVLDLREPDARERLEELLATADVFLTNLRPDALDGLGLEPVATVARHPRLVYCSVSGYGLRGGDRNRPAYDIGAFWARSGLSVQLANSEGVPLNARGGIGDHISGLAALAGLLAAVLEQRQTGRGRVVEVSLLRTGTYVLGWDLSLQETVGKVAKAEARQSNQTPLMNSYRTKDGRWFFFTGLEADRHIDIVYRALGRPDLLDDPRFADARALRKNRTEVIAILDDIVAERTLEEWAARFDAAGVWWAPAQGPADVLEDPQLAANDGFLELHNEADGTTRRSINGPVSFSDLPVARAAPAPFLGQHTDEVLAELATRRPDDEATTGTEPLSPGRGPGPGGPGR